MLRSLEQYFDFAALSADWKTEILAGFTTFVTMAYIIFVNPAILHETGMPLAAVTAIPSELHAAVAAGVGLFIALIGLRNSGIIVPSPATTVTLGNLHDKSTALALFGLLLIATLLARRVRAAMLIGILGTSVLGI